MTIGSLLEFVHDWVDKILNDEESLNIKIIYSAQNAPRPGIPYMVINQPFVHNKLGSGNYGYSDDNGDVDYSIRYETIIRIEEVGGLGENLKLLLDSVNRQDIKELFCSNKVSFLRNENIFPNNDLVENIWETRTYCDMYFLYPDERTYQPGFIETVEIERI